MQRCNQDARKCAGCTGPNLLPQDRCIAQPPFGVDIEVIALVLSWRPPLLVLVLVVLVLVLVLALLSLWDLLPFQWLPQWLLLVRQLVLLALAPP